MNMAERLLRGLFGVDTDSDARLEWLGAPYGLGGWFAFFLAAAIVTIIVVVYRRERRLRTWQRLLLATLRLFAFAMACWILLDPRVVRELKVERRGQAIVLVDTSTSMDELDPSQQQQLSDNRSAIQHSRLQQAVDALETQDTLSELAVTHDVRLFGFDRSIGPVTDIDDLLAPLEVASAADAEPAVYSRDGTHLGSAMRAALESVQGDPVAGALILSDGRSTGGEPWARVVEEYAVRGVPVFTACLGDERVERNLSVSNFSAPEIASVGFSIRLDAEVRIVGFQGQRIDVTLERVDSNRRRQQIAKRAIAVESSTIVERFAFYDAAEEEGDYEYVLRLPLHNRESEHSDNSRRVRVNIRNESMRVFLLAGSSTAEYRRLVRFLTRDRELVTSCWLAGVGADYPQRGDAPIGKPPRRLSELRDYDAVILLDPAPKSLDDEVFMAALKELVVEHGTGLAYVAGENHLHPGANRYLAPLLPVEFDGGGWDSRAPYTALWRPILTPRGLEHPICRLRDDAEENASVWLRLPGFYFFADGARLRPAAVELARHPGGSVAAAILRAGSGLSIYLGTDDLNRWSHARQPGLHERFWSGVVRFLVAGKRLAGKFASALYVDYDRYEIGERVEIEASVLDAERVPVVRSQMSVQVVHDGTTGISTTLLSPVSGRPGWYRGALEPKAAGGYALRMDGGAEATFRVVVLANESADLTPDRYAMNEIARRSGGESLALDSLSEVIDRLPDRSFTEVIGRSLVSLWDSAWVLGFLCCALILEWILRKRWSLN